jgi:23S rRNA G2069 N7-methylase RlmK/C1962 C5-methylase RlmI
MNIESLLETAWVARAAILASSNGALRIFHGPGEGGTHPDLSRIAIEFFQAEGRDAYAWVFSWEIGGVLKLADETRAAVEKFLRGKGVAGAVILERPEKGTPEDASLLFGRVPEYVDVVEFGLIYRIRFLETKHPGLFLDHAPLREWLVLNTGPRRVLNTFSYTGSLSIAARKGGANRVVTLDLSRPTIAWARENWELNFGKTEVGPDSETDFIYGDVFEWFPKLEKRGDRFDAVILDPPSFSRSEKKVFSTAKDLPELHASAFQLLERGGLLITSINSAQIPPEKFRGEIERAAKAEKRKLTELAVLGAPSLTFPGASYLKGWIFRVEMAGYTPGAAR